MKKKWWVHFELATSLLVEVVLVFSFFKPPTWLAYCPIYPLQLLWPSRNTHWPHDFIVLWPKCNMLPIRTWAFKEYVWDSWFRLDGLMILGKRIIKKKAYMALLAFNWKNFPPNQFCVNISFYLSKHIPSSISVMTKS